MLEELKQKVYEANMMLPKYHLYTHCISSNLVDAYQRNTKQCRNQRWNFYDSKCSCSG